MEFLSDIIKKINKENLIENKDIVVVGFSGGPDSVFMVEMLLKLRQTIKFEMILVHINHLLRGIDADNDEEFSRHYAKKNNLKFYSLKADIDEISKKRRISLEEAGREVRYSFYNEILVKERANKIALAHNKDDQIETFMFRLMRGTSISGLCGIDSKKGRYIRPINEIYKKDILEYLDRNNINYRIDKTNYENEFTRNSIRIDLIPFIEERYNLRFKDKIYSLIEEMKDINEFVDLQVKKIAEKKELNIDEILIYNKHLRARIIAEYLYNFNININRNKLFLIENMLEKGGSLSLRLNDKLILLKEYNRLKIAEIECKMKMDEKEMIIPGEIEFGEFLIKAEISKITNKGKDCFYTNLSVGDRIKIRNKRDGDRIIPTGMKNEKKLKDIFVNEKIPKNEREKIPLIEYNGEIIWIVGIRGNDKFKSNNEKTMKFSVRRKK